MSLIPTTRAWSAILLDQDGNAFSPVAARIEGLDGHIEESMAVTRRFGARTIGFPTTFLGSRDEVTVLVETEKSGRGLDPRFERWDREGWSDEGESRRKPGQKVVEVGARGQVGVCNGSNAFSLM